MTAPSPQADLQAIERLIKQLPPDRRSALASMPAVKAKLGKKWQPLPGPQTMAMQSGADEILYGGQGGGGKTDLVLGLAFTEHRRSLIMRKQYTDLSAMTERAIEINGGRKGFNGSAPPSLRTADGRFIEFGAAAKPGDEHGRQGQPHDLLAIDEATQWHESQIRFLMGWVRTTTPGQRCRVVLATNPPLSDEGQFIIDMFAPWLDPTFHDPAKAGELRWYIYDPKGKRDRWVSGPGTFQNDNDETVASKSRTFIPASVRDNPYLVETGYQATLDNLPEPIRSAVRDGNFMAVRTDHEWQVIPTPWIRAAMDRWKEDGWRGMHMTALGVDVAAGGADHTIVARRYGSWFAPLIDRPGVETPSGEEIIGLVVANQRDNAAIVVDVGGNFGSGPVMVLKGNGMNVVGFDGGKPSNKTAFGSGAPYFNKRAEAYWRFREALDPDQDGGSPIALPPDQALLADLTATRRDPHPTKIKIEPKDDIKKRIGRSPDKADAVVMCWSEGEMLTVRKTRRDQATPINLGYAKAKQRGLRDGR